MTSQDPKPAQASTRLRLPLDQLSPADFERLCLWLVRREGFEAVEHLGEAGSEQGRDLVARRDGRRFAFQCKRVQRFAAADAKREIDKIRRLPASEQPDELVFVVTKAVRAEARKLARKAWGDGETCHFWCGTELDERVKRHDEVVKEFFDLGEGRRPKPRDGIERPFRIFLSSTSEDLKDYRGGVAEAIERFDQQAVRMEIFAAEPRAPLEVCRARVAECDAVVVMVAHRYGWVPSVEEGGDGKKSVTWLEVEAALGADKPVFAFLVDPDFPWAGAREELGLAAARTEEEAQTVWAAVRGLRDFKEFLDRRVTRQTFTTPDDLAAKVATSLFPWLLKQTAGDGGGGQPADEEPAAPSRPELRHRVWPDPELPGEPYPLLLPYTHPALFAGRERDLDDLRRSLGRPLPILRLLAPSGAGKSSLLQAGLVPALRAEGWPVSFRRRPDEPELADRLIGDLLEPAVEEADNLPALPDDPEAFVDALVETERLAGKPPLLVLDQFEDLMKLENVAARARLGMLLAATVQDRPGRYQTPCRWLLAYREDFHGKVRTWLRDVLADARELELAAAGRLPHDLADRSHSWPLLPMGTPPSGGDRIAEAARAFRRAIETPLAVAGADGTQRYLWRFAGDGAERLALAFAEIRGAQRDEPLVPELQVVLAHLISRAGEPEGSEPAVIEVPEDPGELKRVIGQALEGHLRRVLEAAFPGQTVASREGRTRVLMALSELADAEGKRGASLPAAEVAEPIGPRGGEILELLAGRDRRVLVALDEDGGRHVVLSHDRLAEVVVRMVEEEGHHGDLDRELLSLRRSVRLSTVLFVSGERGQATRISVERFQRIATHREALIRSRDQRQWWAACEAHHEAEQRRFEEEQRQRRAEHRRRLTWAAAAFVAVAVALVSGLWVSARGKETAKLVERLLSSDPNSLQALHRVVTEQRASVEDVRETLRQRGTSLNLFERGAELASKGARYEALLTAVEVALPLPIDRRIDDLEKRGLLAWTLDYVAVHAPSLESRTHALRRQVFAELPPTPYVEEEDWQPIDGGSFVRVVGKAREEVKLSRFWMLRHEVTNQELRRLVDDHSGGDDLPAVDVSWYTAYAYAAWLGGRLPTEAEWEYAARAGCPSDYCIQEGDQIKEVCLDVVGWYGGNSGVSLHPVKKLKPNPWGLYDMYGNAWEWVADWHAEYPDGLQVEPWGPPSGVNRVVCGGGYGNSALSARAASRDGDPPGIVSVSLGFRVVLPGAPSR